MRPARFVPLLAGPIGNEQTLHAMQGLVEAALYDPQQIVRRATVNVVRGAPGGHVLAEAHRIFRFVRERVEFRRDPTNIELVQDPIEMLRAIDARPFRTAGDCDDHATLAAALGHAIRLPVVFVLQGLDPCDGTWTHVYAALETGEAPSEDWLLGDDYAPSGLVSMDTASPAADWNRHAPGRRCVVPALL